MFSLSHACHGVSRPPAAGSQVPEKGLPGDGGSETQPGLSANTKHDPALSRVGREATTTSWLGITSLLGETQPPLHGGATLHTVAASPTWPQPSALIHSGAKDGGEQAALSSANSRG